ncbi:hypothetical protein JDY09_09560 [Thermoleophilum album]|jgi:hypothetical protein|uniref:hypothetical protein n=1 Tax=Thermoleophilum album TaxID=29539 RepID=UPI00237D31CB|nr:hypothetical protein [Thermoleophilum album]WDT93622.1 hypothetical protein JDY09_09560 [Thermoleophilum album]
MPALPLDEAGKYVAAAYVIFAVLPVIYVAILASKIGRLQSEVARLLELVRDERRGR